MIISLESLECFAEPENVSMNLKSGHFNGLNIKALRAVTQMVFAISSADKAVPVTASLFLCSWH